MVPYIFRKFCTKCSKDIDYCLHLISHLVFYKKGLLKLQQFRPNIINIPRTEKKRLRLGLNGSVIKRFANNLLHFELNWRLIVTLLTLSAVNLKWENNLQGLTDEFGWCDEIEWDKIHRISFSLSHSLLFSFILSVSLSLSVCLSVCLSACLSLCLSLSRHVASFSKGDDIDKY